MLDLFGIDHNAPAKTKEQEYKEYLASAAWRLKRKQVLHRAGDKCEVCGMTSYAAKLDVHHKTYDRFGFESLDDLIVVCRPCHEKKDKERERSVRHQNAEKLREAQFRGWAEKVYGYDWEDEDQDELREEFSEWRQRKGDEW